MEKERCLNHKMFLLSVCVILALSLSGCLNGNSGTSDNGSSWLDTYSVEHGVGNGSDDFWIEYPQGNPSGGQEVEHLSWVKKSIENGPVLFVVHRTGCTGCTPQAIRIIKLAEKYGDYVEFYDIDAVADAPPDILVKSNEAYLYDPNGGSHYIAFTFVATIMQVNNQPELVWHSWEGNVGDIEMETWVKDAIWHYHMNNGGAS